MDYTDYEEYPKTLARDDFWGQVRRTIRGRRITEEELAVVVDALKEGLQLTNDDTLLDLMCGNGALTARLFSSCRSVVGVDRANYLIGVAKEYFERPPEYVFVQDDVLSYVHSAADAARFTKALCYGSLQYLPVEGLASMLTGLRGRFPRMDRVLLGNVPDKERAPLFFGERFEQDPPGLGDPTAPIGVWWSQADFQELAAAAGWRASFSRLPPDVFNAKFRYDAVLQPDG